MRVLVDDSAAFNQGAGIGRYARHVVPAAARALPKTHWTLFYAASKRGEPAFGPETLGALPASAQASVRRAPLSRRRLDQLWFRARLPLPVQVFAGRADVIYSPDFTAPPAATTPRVITVHDLAFLVCPERTPDRLRAYLSAVVPRQVAGAARVITVSETTKRDLIERLDLAEDRIEVVPNGVEERFFRAAPLNAAERQQLGVPDAYLLSVGTIEPRKNHETLFAAIEQLGDRLDLPLLVAGRRGWSVEPILAAGETLRQAKRLQWLDYVPGHLLPNLYAGAAAVVYLSWYEGFGLPVLEALATGRPIVASTAPALRETAGDAAIFADPGSAAAVADAILHALDPSQHSASAREQRHCQARRFCWGRSGVTLANVLREVVCS